MVDGLAAVAAAARAIHIAGSLEGITHQVHKISESALVLLLLD